MSVVSVHGGTRIELLGDDGSIEVDLASETLTRVGRDGSRTPLAIRPEERGGWTAEIDFVRSIRDGASVELTDFPTGVAVHGVRRRGGPLGAVWRPGGRPGLTGWRSSKRPSSTARRSRRTGPGVLSAPSLARIGDEVIAVFRTGSAKVSPDGRIGARSSRDDGRTWSPAAGPFDGLDDRSEPRRVAPRWGATTGAARSSRSPRGSR
jgi:hypothetical protein